MGIGEARSGDLTVMAGDDGTVSVDVGARFVAVGEDDLERLLDNLAADGGTLTLVGGAGRADDGDDAPYRESDPGMNAAGWVQALAERRGIRVVREA
ncbi:MAG: hypothetical protein U0838_03985 [Chloroflexota bacterium]